MHMDMIMNRYASHIYVFILNCQGRSSRRDWLWLLVQKISRTPPI